LTFGPKPGVVDKGCLEIFKANLNPIKDTYTSIECFDHSAIYTFLGEGNCSGELLGKVI